MPEPEVDYAEPADLRSGRRPERTRPAGPLWDGPARTTLRAGCWVAAALLGLTLLLPVLVVDEAGAATPEAAVAQLLRGIVDVDAAAVIAVVDPEEARDRARADAAYGRLSGRLVRIGDEVPPDVTAVLRGAEGQLGGGVDARALASLAAVDLELTGLELEAESGGSSGPGGSGATVRVRVLDGTIDVVLDPGRLPDGPAGLGRATYAMPLAEGWHADGTPVRDPYLVTVERDGRWYVSLQATGDALLGPDLLPLPEAGS